MLDYLDLAADCSGEDQMIRHTAREFVAEQVDPDIGEHFEAGTVPEGIVGRMGELDFFGPMLSWGELPGVSATAYGLLMQELEAGDSGIRSIASVQGALVMYPIAEYGSEAQRERWLPRLAVGDAVGCFGLTEPDHGSDPASMDARADP
ncbi:acyl-CoA dehydrogenase, partial [Halapricum sp. CBA1109]|nr:acyl-CoA dehydrogenase [Halapricum sp. CBA1109]